MKTPLSIAPVVLAKQEAIVYGLSRYLGWYTVRDECSLRGSLVAHDARTIASRLRPLIPPAELRVFQILFNTNATSRSQAMKKIADIVSLFVGMRYVKRNKCNGD